jgi:hypothetical protein
MCSHGPDPAPEGVDPSVPQPLVAGVQSQGFLQPRPPRRLRHGRRGYPGHRLLRRRAERQPAVYAVPADRPDRYDQVVPSIRQWAADTDAVFGASAAKTGGTRHIRFVTDANCRPLEPRGLDI